MDFEDQQLFDRDNYTYEVSEERLRAFMALTPEQRLKWAEEIAYLMRLTKAARCAIRSNKA